MIELTWVPKSDPLLREMMAIHYSAPKGFVGRQLVYRVSVAGIIYGFIAAGSATKFLPGRTDFFGAVPLQNLINNTFFHIEKQANAYPCHNFASKVVAAWRELVKDHWPLYYGSRVLGYESLVELPRTGELYRRDGWVEVGTTKGYTCKRIGGVGTDSWSGQRVWSSILKPKTVFVRKVES